MMKRLSQVALVTALALIANTAMGAVDPDPAVKKTFEKLVGAIQAGDRDAFVADATDAVKDGVTQQVMDALNKQLGARLKKGYEPTYFGQLKQAGYQIHLWKLTFKDGGDDIIVRFALKDSKVAGFVLQ